jgi:dihydroflavonol-4-reductase
MEKVFVTGADGMLGSMICRRLLKKNYSVTALCLPNSNTKTIEDLDLKIVKGNILNLELLISQLKDHHYLIHVAAITTVWPRKSETLRKVNIIGTKNVQQACVKNNIKRMIYVGSASSFTPGTKDKPGDEQTAFTWGKFGMDYINSKYEAQQYLINEYKQNQFPVITINPTFMIGPYDSGPSSGVMLINLYKGKVPGYSNGGKNFVYSGDVAQAIVNSLSKGNLGECYIAGNENLEFKEFFQKATLVMEREFKLKKFPQFLVLSVGAIKSIIARLTKKAPNISYGMASMASVSQFLSNKKAIKELNMPQTPIELAIKESLNWFKENNYL